MQSANELAYGNKRYQVRLLHSRVNEESGLDTNVYEGFEHSDKDTPRNVVLKVYRIIAPDKKTQEKLHKQIKHEKRLMTEVSNAHLPALYNLHTVSPTEIWLEIEHIRGQTLAQYYEDHTAFPDNHTIKNLLRICIDVACALSDMHQHKPPIAHRDITPANIMFSKDFRNIKLIDFGLAALQPWPNEGTPGYRAPEQSPSAEELSIPRAPCDVFGLGAVLYKGLTHKTPSVLRKYPAQPPMAINPAVSTRLNDFLLTMLTYDPSDRPSIRDVRAELSKIRNNGERRSDEKPMPVETPSSDTPKERLQEQVYGASEYQSTSFASFSSGSTQTQSATHSEQQAAPPRSTTSSANNNTPLYDLYNAEFPIPALPPDPPAPPAPPEAMTPNPIGGASSRLIVGMAIMIVMLLLVIILLLFIR
ncbi:MAG: hypothetical protein GFH27_549291n172 [Chloroflexi bacterium AL-W]|nr:hypothetical protein [Chloroflexi bacterium AL-N1]NOK67362.1 hypothetical protein [Chloroflexi bacterium AL-N10]NOK75146.1 hypothetical protein [Chloroflexi bacterium AL-N5]NOK81934.1 hypothetical protein [Chloroflexi bacterium AL-W]NOK89779.1 hypothetical protein [Chloroflexi bacterium AL-N15]